MPDLLTLSEKYDTSVPRYTSYPTIPYWSGQPDITQWESSVRSQAAGPGSREGISLYIHLPFCDSLCTYCGCTKKISRNHAVEEPYLDALLKEWELYRALLGKEQLPLVREIHLGGGTPTFFSPEHLHRLLSSILETVSIHPEHSFSFEGHPNNTTTAHLKTLYELAFRRMSLGVQDTNPEVQRLIHRIQPFENVRHVTEDARRIGFTSVNFDLVYGLPAQTRDRLLHTVSQSLTLHPDRIAFYSYAHLPGMNCGQRLIDSSLLPSAREKLALYQDGKALFTGHGYTDIGMDHFALPGDELYKAWSQGRLKRNFMGYTTQQGAILIGLGMSAISDTGTAFAQNDKTLAGYYKAIHAGHLAIHKNHFLTREDQVFRRHILDIACQGTTTIDPDYWLEEPTYTHQWNQVVIPRLKLLEADGLITWDKTRLLVSPEGRHFIRHICQAFDLSQSTSIPAQHGPDAGSPVPIARLCGKSSLIRTSE